MVRRLTKIARSLRKRQTPTEAMVWAQLRNRKLLNAKFRRQYPIGPYVVDFCVIRYKLVIEIDGGGHNYPAQKIKDRERDCNLELMGYKVMRTWSNEVSSNLEGVIELIIKELNIFKGEEELAERNYKS